MARTPGRLSDEPPVVPLPRLARRMTLLHGLCLALLIPPALACGYYLILAVVALLSRPRVPSPGGPPQTRFAIVIPAQNEEAGIAAALRSCGELDYPADLVRAIVVADNCTDATAAIARRHGAVVLERQDSDFRGKGHALAWALPQVLADRPDAVVLLDADCAVDPQALRAFAARLAAGQRVVQARVVTANPDASPVSYAAAVGNLLENDLFYAPKDRLGGAVFLRGTGMAFARSVLEIHAWDAFSVAEDSEYTLTLLRAGVAVRWAGEVTVRSDAAASVAQLRVQRRRWAAALSGPGGPNGAAMSWRLIDARLTRLVMSRPLVLGATLLAAAASCACFVWRPDAASAVLATAGLTVVALQGLYVLLGVIRLGITPHRLRLLVATPAVVVRLFGIAIRGAAGAVPRSWVRTPRAAAGVE